MNIKLSLRDPDEIRRAVLEQAERDVREMLGDTSVSEAGFANLVVVQQELIENQLRRWVEHGEYVHVVLDMTTGHGTVTPMQHREDLAPWRLKTDEEVERFLSEPVEP